MRRAVVVGVIGPGYAGRAPVPDRVFRGAVGLLDGRLVGVEDEDGSPLGASAPWWSGKNSEPHQNEDAVLLKGMRTRRKNGRFAAKNQAAVSP